MRPPAGIMLTLIACPFIVCLPLCVNGSTGMIIVSGDEWAFSDDGMSRQPAYVNNVLTWFGLLPNGSGKKILILDGQSWNCGFAGTCGAFGATFRNALTAAGIQYTYLGYQDGLVPLTGFDAVFADGLMTKATTLTNDLANFVLNGGAVYVAGGTGTFNPATPSGEATYWQSFFELATGRKDFGLLGGTGWVASDPPLQFAGPVGNGVTKLNWYMGQGVQFGTSPNASPAAWDRQRTLVAVWSWFPVQPVHIDWPTVAGSFFSFSFSTIAGGSYTVQQNTNLETGSWMFCTNLIGDGSLARFQIPFTSARQNFFRIRQP